MGSIVHAARTRKRRRELWCLLRRALMRSCSWRTGSCLNAGDCSLSFCIGPLCVDVIMYCCRKVLFEIAITVCIPDAHQMSPLLVFLSCTKKKELF